MAQLLVGAGMGAILAGNSAAYAMAGHGTKLPITLNQMLYPAPRVVRAGPLSPAFAKG